LFTGMNDKVPFEIADIIVFPNPGKNTLNIQSALKELTVYLFNQEGKQLLSWSFDGNTAIQTGNLKPGVYLYHVVQKDSIIKTGKWIKE
ncbi:MAG: T9SS type A sorting domain-containing protein, partial [Bacteroidales bacterium]|nr:T9SS type A sorting domain-containing protein [Bacteroidales bacterium]